MEKECNKNQFSYRSALQVVEQSEHLVGAIDKNHFEANCNRYILTRREIEVARLLEKGHSNIEIGEMLFISKRTVDKHIENLFEKVDASNKIELINKLKAS